MYEYLVGSLVYLVFWFILYFIRKDLRKALIYCSILFMPIGMIGDLMVIPVYWNPPVHFFMESLILSFSLGGIAGVVYKVVFNKKLRKIEEDRKVTERRVLILLIASIFMYLLFKFAFHLTAVYIATMYKVIFFGVFASLIIMFFRRDLIKASIIGAVLFTTIYFVTLHILNSLVIPNFVVKFWNFNYGWGITFFRIPIEELLWALSFGLFWSSVYEFVEGYALD